MDINWRWMIFMMLVIVTQITKTQNINNNNNNWNQLYKKQYQEEKYYKQNIIDKTNKISDNNNLSNLNILNLSKTKNNHNNNNNNKLDENIILNNSFDNNYLKQSSPTTTTSSSSSSSLPSSINQQNINGFIEKNVKETINHQSTKTTSERKTETLNNDSDQPHSRQKRLIWVTDDGRLALPPGTSLSISPTIAMPFIRYPPDGFLSNITISLPLTIDFDKLGLTDNQNPLGIIPPFLGRSMGRAAGTVLGQYIAKYLHSRKKRETTEEQFQPKVNENFKIFTENIEEEKLPQLPNEHRNAFHGGERAILYTVIEDFISNFGLDGKACLLRAICEVHSKPVHQLGLIGEMMKLFFTASKSPFSELLDEYVSAEKMGEGVHGPGECYPYYKECSRSLFKFQKNRYHQESDQNSDKQHFDEKNDETFANEIHSGPIVM